MYSGNASVVNFFMRWPVLIPVAVAAVAVPVAIEQVTPKPVAAVVAPAVVAPVVAAPVAPAPVVQPASTPVLRKLEDLCPPQADSSKMKKAEKDALRAKGCKVAG